MFYGYDLRIYQQTGLLVEINESIAHTSGQGKSGSGKSHMGLLHMAGQIAEGADITVCDFKCDDFAFLQGLPCYAQGFECAEMIETFYQKFNYARENHMINGIHVIWIDEYAGLLNFYKSTDKKLSAQLATHISEILMLGRSLKYFVYLICQRLDAEYLPNGGRTNFNNTILLGSLDNQQKMINGISSDELPENYAPAVGEGIMFSDFFKEGRRLIKIPYIEDMADWKANIRKCLERQQK